MDLTILSQYASNKGFAEDLTEGKFSFPVVHGIHADSSNRQILSKPTHFHSSTYFTHCLIHFRRTSKEANNANPQDSYHQLPEKSYKVFRLYTLRPYESGGSDSSGNCAVGW